MRIVAASLPYVVGKFGGSIRSRKPPPVCRSSIADTFLLECEQLHSLDGLFEACGIVQTHTNEGLVTFLTSVSNA